MCADGCPSPSRSPKVFEGETLGLDFGIKKGKSADNRAVPEEKICQERETDFFRGNAVGEAQQLEGVR